MRALVAGGAGFLGSHVCEELLRRGHEVTCLDSLITGRVENIGRLRADARFRFVEADVTSAPALEADLILHLASPASPAHYRAHPLETMLANSAGTKRLLDLAAENRARLVFASTSEVYGDPLEHPQTETYWGNVNPIGPRACYDESKRLAETLCTTFFRLYGTPVKIVRPFNVYGPRQSGESAIQKFVTQAVGNEPLTISGDGTQIRAWCYIDDFVDAMLRLLERSFPKMEVFNIGNPQGTITVLELAEKVIALAQSSSSIQFRERTGPDVEVRVPSIVKAERLLGFTPTVGLEAGILATIDDFRKRLGR